MEGSGTTARRGQSRDWLAAHAPDLAVGVMALIALVVLFRATRGTFFFVDDWPFLDQGSDRRQLIEPYNSHLSVIILSTYRLLATFFGLSYTPFRVLGVLVVVAVPVAYYARARRPLGPPLAAVLTVLLLLERTSDSYPGAVSIPLAVLAGIGCAALLDRGRRADLLLAGLLLASLAAANTGLAVGAACLVHNLCTRAPLRRWVAVLGPLALWGLWFVTIGEGQRGDPGPFAVGTGEKVELVRNMAWSAFDTLGMGFGPLAALLLLVALAWAVWQLRQGLAAGANVLAWTAALAVWTIGLAESRGALATAETFRYRQAAIVFVLLAVVPREPIRWPDRLNLAGDRRWLALTGCLLLVLMALRVPSFRDDVDAQSAAARTAAPALRAAVEVIGLGPEVVPDDAELGFYFGLLNAGQVRALVEIYESPGEVDGELVDQRLVEMGAVSARSNGPRQPPRCAPMTEPVEQPTTRGQIFLWNDDGPFTVEVRRFGDRWVPVTEWSSQDAVAVTLPSELSDRPWQVRAIGACRVFPARGE